MRSTFRNWGRERTDFRAELLALSLAHTMGSAVERAYARDDAIEPIGVSCRVCDRQDCEQRAFPSLSTPLRLDENVRGAGFYAATPGEGS